MISSLFSFFPLKNFPSSEKKIPNVRLVPRGVIISSSSTAVKRISEEGLNEEFAALKTWNCKKPSKQAAKSKLPCTMELLISLCVCIATLFLNCECIAALFLNPLDYLKVLYESLSAGDINLQARRPCASLSSEDLTESEWFYLLCLFLLYILVFDFAECFQSAYSFSGCSLDIESFLVVRCKLTILQVFFPCCVDAPYDDIAWSASLRNFDVMPLSHVLFPCKLP
ncbi:hypothetical protein VNO77_18847 [Canavalia gladiata]|uniref:Uncharacterized protein n=1 Tax=Canavalia gladiata TaxID=3824 RepID=A0AAN9LRH9_CANGL